MSRLCVWSNFRVILHILTDESRLHWYILHTVSHVMCVAMDTTAHTVRGTRFANVVVGQGAEPLPSV